MTAMQLLSWLRLGCFDYRFKDVFPKADCGDIYTILDNYDNEEIIERIETYYKIGE